jgi:hypothetical protein
MYGRIVSIGFLMVETLIGQERSEKPLPIAWFSVKSIGTWADESKPDRLRTLKPGDPIYRSSRLVRRDPKSANDAAWLSLPDASYHHFSCSQPLVCDKPLDLAKVAHRAEPRLHAFGLVVNTMSGRRRPLRPVLQDTVGELTSVAPSVIVFSASAPPGKYSLAWCLDALSQKCPDEPLPVTIDWNPKEPASLVPGAAVTPGLHRLILLKQAEGEWFYTEEDAWVLMVQGADAKSRVAQVAGAMKSLHEETKSLSDQVGVRVRAVALLAAEAEASK